MAVNKHRRGGPRQKDSQMSGRRAEYYLLKVNRIAGWLLLPAVLTYVCTGFAICGELRFDRLIRTEVARALHRNLIWPLVAFFLVHAILSIYFAMRRWGWIGPRRST